MADLATLAFTGTDGAAVTGFALTNGGTFVIAGNKGKLKTNASPYSPTFATYTALAARADAELYLEYTPDATLESYLGVSLRSPAAPTGYFPGGYHLYFPNGDGGASLNAVVNGGDQQNIGYLTNAVSGVANGIRFRVFGNTLQARVWKLTDAEPTEWDVSVTDTKITAAGYFALQATTGGGGDASFLIDNVKISDGIRAVAMGTRGFAEFFHPQRLASPVSPIMPTKPIVSGGRTFTPILTEDYNVDAKAGEVLAKYSVMTAYDGYTDTSKQGLYDPAQVLSVHDGYLDIHMRTIEGQARVSAVNPNGYNAMTYGRFSMRYRTRSNGEGYKFVGILWPIDDDWNKGEIDWPEHDIPQMRPRPASANPGSAIFDGDGNQTGMVFSPGVEYPAPTTSEDWHIATTEWTPEEIRCYWDERLILTINKPANIPSTPMRPILQAEAWINAGPVPAGTETHVDVDWVVVSAMTT